MAHLAPRDNRQTTAGGRQPARQEEVHPVSGTGNSPALPDLTDKLIERLHRALLLSPNPRRDRALLQLFLHYGCTVKDVLALREEDVDLAATRIRWGGRETWVPLHPDAQIAIREYCLRERRGHGDRLFTTRLGHPLPRAQVMQVFRFLQRESGLTDLNPNTLRERHRQILSRQEPLKAWMALRRRPNAGGNRATPGESSRGA